MTNLLLLLGFILLVGVGLGATLWRLLRPPAAGSWPAGEEEAAITSSSRLGAYQPMNRLFLEEDFGLIRDRLGLAQRLRRDRKRVLRLYLRELRADFTRVYALCRMLAPRSQDPNFAALITQQALAFYGLLLILHLRCSLGWYLHVGVDTADLVGVFERLREAAQASVLAVTPPPALAAHEA